MLWSPDLGTPRCYELAFSLSPQVVWPLILDTPRGPYPSPLSVLRCTGLMPQSSVYLQVLWPPVVDTLTVHVPVLPATTGALPSDARHPRCPCPNLVTPGSLLLVLDILQMPMSLCPRASGQVLAGPSTLSLSPWWALPLLPLADEGWGAAAARPTVRRVTGRAAPPTAAATPGSSGPRGPEPA